MANTDDRIVAVASGDQAVIRLNTVRYAVDAADALLVIAMNDPDSYTRIAAAEALIRLSFDFPIPTTEEAATEALDYFRNLGKVPD